MSSIIDLIKARDYSHSMLDKPWMFTTICGYQLVIYKHCGFLMTSYSGSVDANTQEPYREYGIVPVTC